ncbi:alpha/beta hydrolase fold domain-containing protein [Nocardia sp. NPDC020380]|uniref:alpha/beta hydrolase fold domain-containing protein n=1 Tax=Nocardia sp. NPDC020380 TaxID=3364309 RepID=UPI00378B5D2F
MALAAAQALLEQGGPQPSRIVLICPWLDVTVSDPALPALEPDDPMHAIAGLREIGRLYAGSLDTRDPRVSPLFGRLEGLAPLTLFSGSRELPVVDARALVRRAAAAGVPVDYHEGPGLPHNYPLMPTPEGRAARKIIIDACRATPPDRPAPSITSEQTATHRNSTLRSRH